MLRCAICDYTSQFGSALLDKTPRSANKVRWHVATSEYLCTDCRTTANINLFELSESDPEFNE
jgi:hypothetical protein